MLHTINALPSDYSGKLTILINDGTLPVVCRNILILLILGTIPDEVMAADIALHFWYSAFMPMEYRLRLSLVLTSFLQRCQEAVAVPLGPNSTLVSMLSREDIQLLLHYISSSTSLDDVQNEYDRVRTAPSRRDFRERMYAWLKPSHRVAFQEFRRFGIVLPFGAVNAHFNVPNLSLFSPEGKWLQTDYADPLEGWEYVHLHLYSQICRVLTKSVSSINAVRNVGKEYGAQTEDIYGCLYFFLSRELRTFARRVRQFPISFYVYCSEACNLSRGIQDGLLSSTGVPASIRFDRIEVSNILDANYVGMSGVLTHWAPLLAESRTAAIVGYFMNWPAIQPDGSVTAAPQTVRRRILHQVMEKRIVSHTPENDECNVHV